MFGGDDDDAVADPGDGRDTHDPATAVVARERDPFGAAAAAESADAEERERNAEIADLRRRVIFGAVLTAPVLLAVMFTELFGVTWVPGFLMNRWLQLALISPVMFYTGWPIHRTGWLALSHRTADMNSLHPLVTAVVAGAKERNLTLVPRVRPAAEPHDRCGRDGVVVAVRGGQRQPAAQLPAQGLARRRPRARHRPAGGGRTR